MLTLSWSWRRAGCALAAAVCCLFLIDAHAACAAEAQWIWSPAHDKGAAPAGDCYFRKSFRMTAPEGGQLALTGDNKFEAFVNGQPVGSGADWRKMQQWDVSKLLRPGINVVAVKVSNMEAGAAGLAGQLVIKDRSGAWDNVPTDDSWRTSVRLFANWNLAEFPDADWVTAQSYGQLGATLPWGNEVVSADRGARFIIDEGFEIERLARDEEVGSLIAMTFDAAGNILVSREGGHLLRLVDRDGNGVPEEVTTYCDKLENVQGILALGSRVFAVGSGPEGPALYRLRDTNRDGTADEVVKLIDFLGSRGEHGAHAVRLGPDGLIYVILGDYARAAGDPTPRSPYRDWYEGDLVQPKHEDPRGHAVGIPAPGGTVIRTDANGSFVETVAGGLRNSYDFAFSPDGELFAYDADMEWDRGAPWYRPTRVNHVIAGAEMGWRSGWSKWPEYYLDSLPPAWNAGAGSPTGLEFYDHTAFPAGYRGAMFACDWGTGHIYAVKFQREGATFKAVGEPFLEGRPLNATDCAVGPDGALYFCTGGRGTDGGVYRVRATTAPPEAAAIASDSPVEQAIAQPQLDADWARANIARFKRAAGGDWGPKLVAVAGDARRPTRDRIRALDLMVFFGPRPTEGLLLSLAADQQPLMRARAARQMYGSTTPATRGALVSLLGDSDALVRRTACESLVRGGPLPEATALAPLLNDDDRFVRFAAMRALQQLPVRSWAPTVLRETRPRPFAYGVTALLGADHPPATCRAVLRLAMRQLDAAPTLTDEQRLDLLRVAQLALHLGNLGPDDAAATQAETQLARMYPTQDAQANRELVRLLVHLQSPAAAEKFAAELQKDLPAEEKLHIAAYAPRLEGGWTTASKLALMRVLEEARTVEAGYSVASYVEGFAREFFAKLTLDERRQVIAGGEKWPASALSALASLPESPADDVLAEIRALDTRVAPLCEQGDAFRRLRVAIIAVLGASPDAASQAHVRAVFQNEPEYRDAAAMSLTQHPSGENWPLLVESLRSAESPALETILESLAAVERRPEDATAYRYAILAGLRLKDGGPQAASDLLAHWAGPLMTNTGGAGKPAGLSTWQKWYAQQYPDAPPAELPADAGQDKWAYNELLTFLESTPGQSGSAERGAAVFTKAQCVNCHRCGARGETIGPDLTSVARRFQQKEILQSIVYPSHIISDQYVSKIVVANGKSYGGLVVPQGAVGVVVLLDNGKQVTIPHEDIEDILPSHASAMPTGLLNALSLDEVADLFAYLSAGANTDLAERPADGGAPR
ncbi:MAG: HEAT repeat domain-containing protein [Planctomycetales bacterium]|nr:HEAT repeat domain-containing protein [Planctomycetales bacterium]